MMRNVLKSKIHRATVTQADLDYEGSVTIDETLMAAAHLNQPGDIVILATFAELDDAEVGRHVPTVVHVDERNRITARGAVEVPGPARRAP